MMTMETKLSISTEHASLQNLVTSNEDQPRMCLLPSKHHCRRYPHISSALNHEYIPSFRSKPSVDNKMIPYGYYLHSGQCINEHDGSSHQILPLSASSNSSLVSRDSSASIPNCNRLNSTQQIKYENYIQPCPITNYQHIWRPSYSLPTIASLKPMPTSVFPSAKTKRKNIRRIRRLSAEQRLPQYPSTFSEPILSNYWPSLPLPSTSDTLTRPYGSPFPVNLMRPTNYAPLPHQTLEQCSLDQRDNRVQKTFNNPTASNLSNNPSHLWNHPHAYYYMLPSNSIPMHIPSVACPTLLPESDTTFSPLSLSNSKEKVRQNKMDPQKSEAIENSLVDVQTSEKSMVSVRRRHRQKQPNMNDHCKRTEIKRIKQKTKLALLKFMIQKRKQQQISKKTLSELKIEDVIPPMETETKSTDIIASSLKITFNAAQKIECISLYYHQHPTTSQIKARDSLITSDDTENRLNLLIKAINLIETKNGSSKLALEPLD